MKKMIAVLGSLLVFAGVKAQTVPTVKKETVKPVKTDTAIVLLDTTQKQLKNSSIKQINPAIKKTIKLSNDAIKMKETAKPVKG